MSEEWRVKTGRLRDWRESAIRNRDVLIAQSAIGQGEKVQKLTVDQARKATFNTVAALYDEVRPSYPQALVEDVIELSGIPVDGRILEIGPGPGKATVLFARYGYRILGLELGENLAEIARHNLRPYPDATILNTTFEAWPVEPEAFDLVIAAQSFHWIPPEIGYAKIHEALKPTGAVALFWNHYAGTEGTFEQEADEIYCEIVPELIARTRERPLEAIIADRAAEMATSGFLEGVEVRRYAWSERYDAERYIKLHDTYSDHRTLDDERRERLFAAIRELINKQGSTVERHYLAVLYFARRG